MRFVHGRGSIAGAKCRTTARRRMADKNVRPTTRMPAPLFKRELDYLRRYLAGVGVLDSGTRNWVWQCWHLTILPRTSAGTTSSLRHLRLGQISWTAIMRVL